MNVGSKYKLYIPSTLAYGWNGTGEKIAPNSTLIFEGELLSIEPQARSLKSPVRNKLASPPVQGASGRVNRTLV
jgi:hypothetical protein